MVKCEPWNWGVDVTHGECRGLVCTIISIKFVAHLGRDKTWLIAAVARLTLTVHSIPFHSVHSIHPCNNVTQWWSLVTTAAARMKQLKIYTFRPVAKQQAYALAVVRPPDTLRDGGADVDSDELGTRLGMSLLRNGVRDLPIPKQ